MVNGDDYFDRMVSVEEEYQFAQRALHSFATTKETVDQFAHEELGSFHELLTNAPKKFGVANRKSLGFCARWHCSIFRICQGECTAPRRGNRKSNAPESSDSACRNYRGATQDHSAGDIATKPFAA